MRRVRSGDYTRIPHTVYHMHYSRNALMFLNLYVPCILAVAAARTIHRENSSSALLEHSLNVNVYTANIYHVIAFTAVFIAHADLSFLLEPVGFKQVLLTLDLEIAKSGNSLANRNSIDAKSDIKILVA